MKLFSVMLTTCLATGVSLAGAFQNGSFESPGGTSFRYLGCNDGFVTGWFNDASNCAGLQFYQLGGIFGPPSAGDGAYYVGFGANGTHGGTLQQTFDTIAGATYKVNYLVVLTNPADTNLEPQSMKVQAFDGANLLGTSADNNFINLAWTNGPTLTFTATSTSTTLIFTDTTTPTSFEEQNWGLDGVTVTQPISLYNVCPLYDSTKTVKSGSTIPIKLQLCDNSGNDVSSSNITVHSVSLTQVSTSISGTVQDSGNANPDNDFRFDSTLGNTGGYIFNLSTKGLTTGTYTLTFTVVGDSFVYAVPFQVK